MPERCQNFEACGHENAERYRQNTRYVNEESNWVTLCPECRELNDEYWREMWADYWSMVLG